MENLADDRAWYERVYGLAFRWHNEEWVVAYARNPSTAGAEWRGWGETEEEAFRNLQANKRLKEARDEHARRHYTGTDTSTFWDFNWH
jgi:hypothetical protein